MRSRPEIHGPAFCIDYLPIPCRGIDFIRPIVRRAPRQSVTDTTDAKGGKNKSARRATN